LIYLAQTADESLLKAAVQAGMNGCLLRGEVRVGVVWAVVWACQGEFVYSQGLALQLRALLPQAKRTGVCVQPWVPSPQLTPRLLAGFWMRVILGLRANQAAQRMGVEAGTVERYITHAYQALQGSEAGEGSMHQVDLDGLSPEERNFLFYTQPKRIAK
jgi:DNA-binding NarL/FixJ family response regulator